MFSSLDKYANKLEAASFGYGEKPGGKCAGCTGCVTTPSPSTLLLVLPASQHLAVDGSSISNKATALAASFTNTKRGDKLQIFHVSDRTKTYLPPHLKPAHLKHYYEDLAAQHHAKADWVCREKEEGQSTCFSGHAGRCVGLLSTDMLGAVSDFSLRESHSTTCIGHAGRCVRLLSADVLGAVSDFSLRESHSSTCIVRSTSSRIERQATFMIAIDGSHASMIAFVMVTCMLKRSLDIVNVVMVTASDGTKEQETINHYVTFMKEHKIAGKAFVKTIDRTNTTVPVGILDAVSETASDVLVLGISGYGRNKLGSVSEDTIAQASCTTLVIKDGLEINANRYSQAGAKGLGSEMCVSSN
eukprot:gene13860-19783_t